MTLGDGLTLFCRTWIWIGSEVCALASENAAHVAGLVRAVLIEYLRQAFPTSAAHWHIGCYRGDPVLGLWAAIRCVFTHRVALAPSTRAAKPS